MVYGCVATTVDTFAYSVFDSFVAVLFKHVYFTSSISLLCRYFCCF